MRTRTWPRSDDSQLYQRRGDFGWFFLFNELTMSLSGRSIGGFGADVYLGM